MAGKKQEPRVYRVLQEHEANVWTVRASVEALSAEAAIRGHVDKHPPDGTATFVAIASRSFQPVTVTVETVSRVKFAGAAAMTKNPSA